MPRSPTPAITIEFPGALRPYCGGVSELSLAAPNLRAVLEELERRFPFLHRNLCDETGRLRRHLNLFVNTSLIRDHEDLDAALAEGDVVTILPAVSGG